MKDYREALGQKGRDVVTGFEGRITGYCTYLTGCDQYLLSPEVKQDGDRRDGHWFDVTRVQITAFDRISLVEHEEVTAQAAPGADMPAPIR